MSWILHIRDKAKKNLARFPRKDQERVDEILRQMRENPYFGDLVKLGGEENLWRRRTGSYRIKFQIKVESNIVFVYEIERRTSKTY